MITFISYIPGSRGKFVTEICDLSMNKTSDSKFLNAAGGHITWLNLIRSDLESKGIDWKNVHIMDPEIQHYKFYVDSIVSSLSKYSTGNFFVDTHCIEYETLNYMLESGCKVIRIVVDDKEQSKKIQNDFFYKNFIVGFSNDETKLKLAIRVLDQARGADPEEDINFASTKFHLPLNQWGEAALKILYNACRYFCFKTQQRNIIEHSNLLEFNYNDILKIETILKLVEFVDGEFNDHVKNRFENYVNEQSKIPAFDEYIKDFIKC